MPKIEVSVSGRPRLTFHGKVLASFPWNMREPGKRTGKKSGGKGTLYQLRAGNRFLLVVARNRRTTRRPQGFFYFANSLPQLFDSLFWRSAIVEELKKHVDSKLWTLNLDRLEHQEILCRRGGD